MATTTILGWRAEGSIAAAMRRGAARSRGAASRAGRGGWRALVAAAWLVAAPGVVSAQGPPGVVEYYAVDTLGSVRVVFDAAGAVTARSDYLPFGEAIAASGNLPPQRFTGQARDSAEGMDHFNARNLLRTGRFNRVDLIFAGAVDPQQWSRYSYARNNPLRYTDPTGLLLSQCTYTDFGVDCTYWPDPSGGPGNGGGSGGSHCLRSPCDPGDSSGGGPPVTPKQPEASPGEPTPPDDPDPPRDPNPPGPNPVPDPKPDPDDGVSGIVRCSQRWRLSTTIGSLTSETATPWMRALEISGPISIVSDMFAIRAKGSGALGTQNRYASGLNRAFRSVSTGATRGVLTSIGNVATPALAVTGVFSLSYNSTIDIQCATGVLR